MRILVHGKNLEVTDALQDYAKRKLARLNDVEDGEIHVTFSVHGHQPLHKVEVTLRSGGTMIRAEEATDDMYVTIDQVADKLIGKFRRWRDKIRRQFKRGGAKALASEQQADEEAEEGFDVARIKMVDLKPIDIDEAILQMNLLDHAFHVFINAETSRTEVVYRRYNGTYGVIRNEM